MAAWEALAEIFAVSGYIEALAARPRCHEAVANVRKLLLLATERPDLSAAEFGERIGDIESLRHQESEASIVEDDGKAVRVLTIHSAKGLEFPIVVLPQTHDVIVRKIRDIEVDTRIEAFSPHLQGEQAPFHVFLGQRRKDREREDAARLLYVALTRAERRLAVVTHAQAGNDTFAGILARAVGLSSQGKPSGFRIREEEIKPQPIQGE
jgi:ATP-dependent exoDNAse (exonuclease V) beta subunit